MEKIIEQFRIKTEPNYVPHADEVNVFDLAFRQKIPLIIKGPTGCGKTRFVEYMAWKLDLPLVTVSCHEDLTASDLVGRFLLKGEETVWCDGPLTIAVRNGGICYLDEIVEARKDTTVIIHSLTDDRRMLFVDKTREVIRAHPNFIMVMSYNPGYQNITKELKHSTRQRFTSLQFDHPRIDVEEKIVTSETGLDAQMSRQLAEMGRKIRNLKGFGLTEGVSSRLLVYAGRLMAGGLSPRRACETAITCALTDDAEVARSVRDIIDMYFGDLMDEAADSPEPTEQSATADDA
ncbi:MAG: CbbQ/NirQ/NorQ/GpvN family protein [Planctomycetota bacterium]